MTRCFDEGQIGIAKLNTCIYSYGFKANQSQKEKKLYLLTSSCKSLAIEDT